MSQAEELLNSLASISSSYEEHIIIGTDRFITVPKALKRIAVQYDHNIETVTFDCPRYWDDLDMSKMIVYIMYILPDGKSGTYPVNSVVVDDFNDSIMHFNWTISRNLTMLEGPISFLVCIKNTDADGNEVNHWNSEINTEMYISKGMECANESELLEYPDIVTQTLLRMKTVEDLVSAEHFIPEATLTETDEGVVITITDIDKSMTATVKHGASGVYVGSGDMPEWCNVQIDPSGDGVIIDVSEVGQ